MGVLQRAWRLILAFRGLVLVLIAIAGGLVDIPGVAERYPNTIGRYFVLPDRETVFWGILAVLGAYILWTDLRRAPFMRMGPYSSDRLKRAMPIFDIEMSLSRLDQSAPWVEFYLFGFNGTNGIVVTKSATGRLKIGGQEFHERLELLNITTGNDPASPQEFFQINIRAPLSEAATVLLREKKGGGVRFTDAFVTAYIGEWPFGRSFNIPLPSEVALSAERRQISFARRLSQEQA